jgi:hypothetical protein
MATIGNTVSIPNPGYNPWLSKVEVDVDTGVQTAYVYGSSGRLLYTGTPQEVVSQIPTNGSYSTDKAFFDGLISTIDGQSATLASQYQQLVPAANNTNEPPGDTTPDPNTLTGSSDDDGSYDKAELAKLSRQGQVAQNKTDTNTAAANAGTTVSGQSDTVAAKKETSKGPGRRTANPLSKFSSSTYQLTLYMVTPDAYAAFVQSGKRNINSLTTTSAGSGGNGAYVIAQSGGINNNTSNRAPGFDLDYYIDNLKVKTLLTGKDTKGAVILSNFSFDIMEPYGFSFISNLARAKNALEKVSTSKNFQKSKPARQLFVLGIRFQGYDKNGKVMTGREVFANDTFDPNGNSDGIFERFFDIVIEDIKFKLGNSMTTYHITGKGVGPEAAMTVSRGLLKNGAQVTAKTIKDALTGPKGLLTKLNKDQQELFDGKVISIKNEYDVVYLGEAETSIGGASLITKDDLDKTKLPLSTLINKTADSNPAFTVQNTPNLNLKVINFRTGEPVLQAIQQLIAQSSYLQDALIAVEKSELEPPKNDPQDGQLESGSQRRIKWYNISTQVIPLGFDTKISDFAFKITYIIQPYETPVIVSTYANKTTRYYGPHKKYDYLFTGNNTEIISYEQTLNNNYKTVFLQQPKDGDAANGGEAGIPAIPDLYTDGSRDGKLPGGMEAQNNYLTNLSDPSSWATAKMQILGDPDYLMQDTSTGLNQVYSQFYGADGFTINPAGGQVFIEINFKEAVDYKNSTGTMSLNDAISFGAYPPDIKAQLSGVSYWIRTVTSMFRQGKFTQELDLSINTFGKGNLDTAGKSNSTSGTSNTGGGRSSSAFAANDPRRLDRQQSASAPAEESTNTTDPMGTDDGAAIMNAAGSGVTRVVPTTSGSTADDDGGGGGVGEGPNIPI